MPPLFLEEWLRLGGMATIAFGTIGVLASKTLPRLAGYSLIISTGTLLATVGAGEKVFAGVLFYLISSTLTVSAFYLLLGLLAGAIPMLSTRRSLTRCSRMSIEGVLEQNGDREVGVVIPASLAILGGGFLVLRAIAGGPAATLWLHRQGRDHRWPAQQRTALEPSHLDPDRVDRPFGARDHRRTQPRRNRLYLDAGDSTARSTSRRSDADRTSSGALPRTYNLRGPGHGLFRANCPSARRYRGFFHVEHRERAGGLSDDEVAWLPYPLLASALLTMWLLLNQSVAPGQLVLGGAVAMIGCGAMASLDPKRCV